MWHQLVHRLVTGEARAPPAPGEALTRRGRQVAQFVPAAMLLVMIGSGTVMMFAARSHRAWLVAVAVVVLAASLAGLAVAVTRLDRRMRGDEWKQFEEAFWRYVNRRDSGGRHE